MAEVQPYMEDIRADGATPVEAVRALLETFYMFRHGSPEHKRALALSMMQQYNITFDQPLDPGKARLEHELDVRKLGDRRGAAQSQTNTSAEITNTIEAFRAAPGHEHFETVRDVMAGLVREGQVQNLQEAYDQACWAHPKIRPLLLQQQDVQRATTVLPRARAAASSITGGPGSVATGKQVDPKNLRGLIESQFEAPGGRV